MNHNDKDRFIDDLLNSILSKQRGAQPRVELEAHVLEFVRMPSRRQKSIYRHWKFWTAALATVAIVIAISIVQMVHTLQYPASQSSQDTNNVALAPAHGERVRAPSEATPQAIAATAVATPKRTVHSEGETPRQIEATRWPPLFHTWVPLSEEKKTLIGYVREKPPQVPSAPAQGDEIAFQHVQIESVQISPLEINPVESGAARGKIR